jgi:hypothetical protein
MRKRRPYDSRRTFISLGLDGGASKDMLQNITHPRPAGAFDLHRTPSWVARCEAVLKLILATLRNLLERLETAGSNAVFRSNLSGLRRNMARPFAIRGRRRHACSDRGPVSGR